MHYQASYSRGDRIERHTDQVKMLESHRLLDKLKTHREKEDKRDGVGSSNMIRYKKVGRTTCRIVGYVICHVHVPFSLPTIVSSVQFSC